MTNIIFNNIPYIKKLIIIVIISLIGNFYIMDYIDQKYALNTDGMLDEPLNYNEELKQQYEELKNKYNKLLPYKKYLIKYKFDEQTLDSIKDLIVNLLETLKNGNIINENIQKINVEQDTIYINKININILLDNNLSDLEQKKYKIILNYFLSKMFTRNIKLDQINISYQNINIILYKR